MSEHAITFLMIIQSSQPSQILAKRNVMISEDLDSVQLEELLACLAGWLAAWLVVGWLADWLMAFLPLIICLFC